jgi:hypothetical protein
MFTLTLDVSAAPTASVLERALESQPVSGRRRVFSYLRVSPHPGQTVFECEGTPGMHRDARFARDDRRCRSWRLETVKKLYVGNLPFSATDTQVKELFSKHGTVHSVALINDRDTGRPRGFGFVEMDDDAAKAAIQGLNGHSMDNRELRVNEAADRPQGNRSGGGRW